MVSVYQDVGPHLEYAAKCRRAERETRGEFGKRGDLHRTMSVPFNVIAAVARRDSAGAGDAVELLQTHHEGAEEERVRLQLR